MSDIDSAMDRTPLHIIVPVLMYCAMLFWIGRRFSWSQRLAITAVTLTLILIVVLVERGGFGLR
jgi:low affinity Fe/Cu permease